MPHGEILSRIFPQLHKNFNMQFFSYFKKRCGVRLKQYGQIGD